MSNLSCTKCDSTEIWKQGLRKGEPQYMCKKCSHSFTKLSVPRDGIPSPSCIKCKSSKVKKYGIVNGEQKYKCNDCSKQFVKVKIPKKDNSYNKVAVLLKISYNTIKGWTKKLHNSLLQICKEKEKSSPPITLPTILPILDNTVLPTILPILDIVAKDEKSSRLCVKCESEISPDPPCIKCKADNVVKRGFFTGEQQYNCKDCSYIFTKRSVPRDGIPSPLCVKCKSSNTKKGGIINGEQRYRCNDCSKQFGNNSAFVDCSIVSNSKPQPEVKVKPLRTAIEKYPKGTYRYPPEAKMKILNLYKKGYDCNEISHRLNIPTNTTEKFLKTFPESVLQNRKEKPEPLK